MLQAGRVAGSYVDVRKEQRCKVGDPDLLRAMSPRDAAANHTCNKQAGTLKDAVRAHDSSGSPVPWAWALPPLSATSVCCRPGRTNGDRLPSQELCCEAPQQHHGAAAHAAALPL